MEKMKAQEDFSGRLHKFQWARNTVNHKRVTNGFGTYNAGQMSRTRARFISQRYRHTTLAILGTGRVNQKDMGVHENTPDHWVVHFTAGVTKRRNTNN